MTFPHLLRYEENNELPSCIFSDLQLTELLSSNAKNVLSHPCGQQNLKLRQELFSKLEENSYKIRLSECLVNIRKLDNLLQRKNEDLNLIEKNYLRLNTIEQYILVCHEIGAFSDGGRLFLDISEYLSQREFTIRLDNMQNDCQEVRNLLIKTQTLYLSFMDKNWVTPADASETIFDEICVYADGLGFSVPNSNKQTFVIDDSLVNSICTLYSEEMNAVDKLLSRYEQSYLFEPTILISEISFFLEITDLFFKAKQNRILTCLPEISNQKEFFATKLIDISLMSTTFDIIPNDAFFSYETPFYFLTGANGGGKTTYLRAVATNLILFLSGCPVFAEQARIYPFSGVWTHFSSDERFVDVGRLGDEVRRVNEMLQSSNNDTFVLFNETFSGTDVKRGYELLVETATKLRNNGYFGLYVTHFLEVVNTDFPILTVEINKINHNQRTFRVVGQRGNVSSYAADILRKYHLDKDSLAERSVDYGI